MASSSSLSGSSVDPTLTAKEIEDLKQLCIFAESDEFDFDDNEFNEVEVEPNSNCKAKVDALAHKFGVKLTEKGVGILTKLVGHFSLNNNAEYIVRQFPKLNPDIPEMFVGLDKLVDKLDAASALRKIIEEIVSPAIELEETSSSTECTFYDRQVIIYMAGHILHKAAKKNKRWEYVISKCSSRPGFEITKPDYNYYNFMNSEKYDGRLDYYASPMFVDFLISIHCILLTHAQKNMRRYSLISLHNQVMASVAYTNFLQDMENVCDCDIQDVEGFCAFAAKLFNKACFMKLVRQKTEKMKSDGTKAKPLRATLRQEKE